jgi:hypothetical protein
MVFGDIESLEVIIIELYIWSLNNLESKPLENFCDFGANLGYWVEVAKIRYPAW